MKYKNAGGFFDDLKYTAQEKAEDQLKAQKLQTLASLAAQPASSVNKWIIIIPVAVLLIGGVTAFILLKKKK